MDKSVEAILEVLRKHPDSCSQDVMDREASGVPYQARVDALNILLGSARIQLVNINNALLYKIGPREDAIRLAQGTSPATSMQQGAVRMGTQPFDASSPLSKEQVVAKALQAKAASGKTYAQIASEIGCTNLYTAALFYNQQQLKPDTAKALAKAVPGIDPQVLELMQKAPMRRFDPNVIQEPAVYRFYEAVMHNAEALKALINEEAGDGIVSAIDVYATVETVTGKQGEKRVVFSLSGKFLPFVEGKTADDVRNK